jgi:hypothetical protein
MAKNRIPDDLIDLALEATFPASDRPFFMGSGGIGAPGRTRADDRSSRDQLRSIGKRDTEAAG